MHIARLAVIPTTLLAAILLSGCPCGTATQGELTPFSGRFGYFVEGPWGFQGALTKQEINDPEWLFEGSFQFPSSGYIALPPSIEVQESSPEQVIITLRVITPPEHQAVLPVITPATLRPIAIAASDEAVFDIRFEPLCLFWPTPQ